MFVVTTAAPDRTLLTITELRAAVGVSDNSLDAVLTPLGARVAAMIARECKIAASGVTPPTLRSETITETWRLKSCTDSLFTARRFISSVTSVTVDGAALAGSDYEFEGGPGFLFRLSSDDRINWSTSKVVAVYTAGFDTVPDDLKMAASMLVADLHQSGARDPNVKRIKIEGVSEREYFYGAKDDPSIPSGVSDMLGPYKNVVIC